MESFIKFVLYSVTAVFSDLFSGYVLSTLWGWFIVSKFGLPALSVPYALGIMVIATFLTARLAVRPEGEKVEYMQQLAFSITKAAMCLLMGYIYLQFV